MPKPKKKKLGIKADKQVSHTTGTKSRKEVSTQVSRGARNPRSKQVSLEEEESDSVLVAVPDFKVLGETDCFILAYFKQDKGLNTDVYWVMDKREYHVWSAVFHREQAERCFRKVNKKYSGEFNETLAMLDGVERQHKSTQRGRLARKDFFVKKGFRYNQIILEKQEVSIKEPMRKTLGKKKVSPPVKKEKRSKRIMVRPLRSLENKVSEPSPPKKKPVKKKRRK